MKFSTMLDLMPDATEEDKIIYEIQCLSDEKLLKFQKKANDAVHENVSSAGELENLLCEEILERKLWLSERNKNFLASTIQALEKCRDDDDVRKAVFKAIDTYDGGQLCYYFRVENGNFLTFMGTNRYVAHYDAFNTMANDQEDFTDFTLLPFYTMLDYISTHFEEEIDKHGLWCNDVGRVACQLAIQFAGTERQGVLIDELIEEMAKRVVTERELWKSFDLELEQNKEFLQDLATTQGLRNHQEA